MKKKSKLNLKPNQGFVQIKRSLLRSKVFQNPNHLRVYLWCQFKANFKSNTIFIETANGQHEVNLKIGEFVTGRFKGAEELGIPRSTFWSWLKALDKSGVIKLSSRAHYTIVKVMNYGIEQQNDNKMIQ